MSVVVGIPEEAGVAFLAAREANMLEESMEVQNKTRDLRVSTRILSLPLSQVLYEDLITKHAMVEKLVRERNKGQNHQVKLYQVESARCIQDLAVEQALNQGRGRGIAEQDLYITEILGNHAQVKIQEAIEGLFRWAEFMPGDSQKKVSLNYILSDTLYTVARLFEVRANIVKQVQARETACGLAIDIRQQIQRLYKSQNTVMLEKLRTTIDKALTHGVVMQQSNVTCNGAVYKPIVEDIVLFIEKNNQLDEIRIPGIQNFTKSNREKFLDAAIDQISTYVLLSSDNRDFTEVLNIAIDFQLGDFRTVPASRNLTTNLLRVKSGMRDALFMPWANQPLPCINVREALLRQNTASGDLYSSRGDNIGVEISLPEVWELERSASFPEGVSSGREINSNEKTHLISGLKMSGPTN